MHLQQAIKVVNTVSNWSLILAGKTNTGSGLNVLSEGCATSSVQIDVHPNLLRLANIFLIPVGGLV